MTHKERYLTAINHEEPDMVPVVETVTSPLIEVNTHITMLYPDSSITKTTLQS